MCADVLTEHYRAWLDFLFATSAATPRLPEQGLLVLLSEEVRAARPSRWPFDQHAVEVIEPTFQRDAGQRGSTSSPGRLGHDAWATA